MPVTEPPVFPSCVFLVTMKLKGMWVMWVGRGDKGG